MYNENLEYIVSHFKDGVEQSLGTVFVNGKNVSKSVLIPLINALSDEEAEKFLTIRDMVEYLERTI